MNAILTDTLEIAYEEAGEPGADPVVLLHGFPDDPKAWAAVSQGLSAAGFRTIAPYLRGFGATRFRRPETPRSGQQGALAQDLKDLIIGLDLHRPILVGYDWGARAASLPPLFGPPKSEGSFRLAVITSKISTRMESPLQPWMSTRLGISGTSIPSAVG